MADNNYDCVTSNESNLLCTETTSLCFDDSDSVVTDEQTHQSDGDKGLIFGKGLSDPLIDLPILNEESFSLMVERETHHLPTDDYLYRLRTGDLDLSLRREALDWIWKAHSHFGYGEFSLCLSMNYFDRFLSMYEFPRSAIWAMQLLAVACLSLAAKLEENTVPLTVDLQVGDPRFVFEGKTIKKMELLVLTTLKWRMQAYTPCTFLDYFLRKINGDEFPSLHIISRSMELILSTIKGIDFLEFRPSEVAAAVAIFVSGQTKAIDIIKAMPPFTRQMQKERLMKCLELIHNLKLKRKMVSGSVPQSPNGVLEAACFSYKIDELAVRSCPSSSTTSPDNKRRRLENTTTTTEHNTKET